MKSKILNLLMERVTAIECALLPQGKEGADRSDRKSSISGNPYTLCFEGLASHRKCRTLSDFFIFAWDTPAKMVFRGPKP